MNLLVAAPQNTNGGVEADNLHEVHAGMSLPPTHAADPPSPPAGSKTLFLIRHAESINNV